MMHIQAASAIAFAVYIAYPASGTAVGPPACSTAEIHSIQAPCNPSSPSSPRLPLAFRFRPPKHSGGLTVVVLQGGPGLPGIGRQTWPIPDDLGVVQLDPRGVGCNNPFASCENAASASTAMLADDVLAVLDELRLGPFVLWGASYGSALATVVASKLERRGGATARAVVLEGPVGTAFTSRSPLDGYTREWKVLLQRLAPVVREQLERPDPPLHASPAVWGRMLQEYLALGEGRDGSHALAELLGELAAPELSHGRLAHLLQLTALQPPLPAAVVKAYSAIACRELFRAVSSADADFQLRGGALVPAPADLCSPNALIAPFSASHWPIRRTPLIYVAGENDPVTPMWQTEAHLDSESGADRLVVSVPGGGHEPLVVALGDCAPALFGAAAQGLDPVAKALGRCQHPLSLRRLQPGRKRPLPSDSTPRHH